MTTTETDRYPTHPSYCLATGPGTRCTLHRGHAGTHYDSILDESFEETEAEPAWCSVCKGTGLADPPAPEPCHYCRGTGLAEPPEREWPWEEAS